MSTYTDLKNRVKETITVGFRPEDRVTTQKVRFYNEENEYWGSFSGNLSGKIDVCEGKLVSVDIRDAVLTDPAIRTSGGSVIELGSIADKIEDLSAYAHIDLSGAVDRCCKDIADISDVISAFPGGIAEQVKELSAAAEKISSDLSAETYIRTQRDSDIVEDYTLSVNALIETDDELYSRINGIQNGLSDEIENRKQADDEVRSYSDRNRHYEIHSVDGSRQMPLKAKEFAVNKLVIAMPDGFVVDDCDQMAGFVSADGSGKLGFTAYSDANYEIERDTGVSSFPYADMLGQDTYTFESGISVLPCADDKHELVYAEASSGVLSDDYFDIRKMRPGIRLVKNGQVTIGHVYDAGEDAVVSAGVLQFAPSALKADPVLSAFADDRRVAFSTDDSHSGMITAYSGCKLQIVPSDPSFRYMTQVSAWNLKLLSGGFECFGARVYENLLVKENDVVKQFAVSMRYPGYGDAQHDFTLTRDDQFEFVLSVYENGAFDLLKYDEDRKKISYVYEEKYLSCSVKITERDKTFELPLESLVANTEVKQAVSAQICFAQLSSAVSDSIRPLVLIQYDLVRSDSMLSCEYFDSAKGSALIQIGDDGTVRIEFTAKDGSKSVFNNNNTSVDFNCGVYSDKSQTFGECEFDADTETFDDDPPDERYESEGFFQIENAVECDDEYVGLHVKSRYQRPDGSAYGIDDIMIEIPDKAEESDESREFMFVIYPIGSRTGQKAEIKFVTPRGEPIYVFANHEQSFKIDCGTYTTFRVQEISRGKFALLDWDQSVQESRLDKIEEVLGEHKDTLDDHETRISGLEDLVPALSNEITGIIESTSSDITSTVSNISAQLDSDINGVSAAAVSDFVKLSGSNVIDLGENKPFLIGNTLISGNTRIDGDIDITGYARVDQNLVVGNGLSVNELSTAELTAINGYVENELFANNLIVNELSAAKLSAVSLSIDFDNLIDTQSKQSIIGLGSEIRNEATKRAMISVDDCHVKDFKFKHISYDDYYDLVLSIDGLSTDLNTLYVISSDNMTMYGQKITDLRDGESASDAATYGQVAAVKNKIYECINSVITANEYNENIQMDLSSVVKCLIDIKNALSA